MSRVSLTEYQSQAHPLTPSQLVQTYLLLLAAQSKHQPYFAFFNCGELSGASQPHKHIQFIPGEAPIDRVAKSAKVENEGESLNRNPITS
jgi:sulfate adenylyltransferase (ADP) / ATP adenylyltransferase